MAETYQRWVSSLGHDMWQKIHAVLVNTALFPRKINWHDFLGICVDEIY